MKGSHYDFLFFVVNLEAAQIITYLCAMQLSSSDTIVAPATAQGVGAIALIRLSGDKAISISNSVFKGKDLTQQATHTVHFGHIVDGGKVIDEVLVSVFKGPNSFTKEDVVEISTHGSDFIVQQILRLLVKHGARSASPGEFTKRAFMNGRFDLAQAEAVADLIASDSAATHEAALNQMRGGFSNKIKELREQLVHFASMVELELDFGEEDVEFADRDDLNKLITELKTVIGELISSFEYGNAIKNGIPTVIAGKPNAGKSTLLNQLLNEEKAIVSDIPGTTRDFIEDELIVEGIRFRFIDTAGLRDTEDKVEAIGVARTKEQMSKAALIIYLFDTAEESLEGLQKELNVLESSGVPILLVGNKIDKGSQDKFKAITTPIMYMSASAGEGIEELKTRLLEVTRTKQFKTGNIVVTNTRHYESLLHTQQALDDVVTGLENRITGDLLAMDIRQSLHHLGEITGEITSDDLLKNIFGKFCIGK